MLLRRNAFSISGSDRPNWLSLCQAPCQSCRVCDVCSRVPEALRRTALSLQHAIARGSQGAELACTRETAYDEVAMQAPTLQTSLFEPVSVAHLLPSRHQPLPDWVVKRGCTKGRGKTSEMTIATGTP